MKIGVWLDSNTNEQIGGGFSYYDRLVNSIDNYSFDNSLDICFVTNGNTERISLKKEVIQLKTDIQPSLKEKFLCRIPMHRQRFKNLMNNRINNNKNKYYINQLNQANVKILYFLNPAFLLFNYLKEFPFIATNWDIGHRSTFTFPEVASNYEISYRDNYYNNILPRALMIFCESNAGINELVKYTTINKDRMRVVPMFPGKNGIMTVSVEKQNEILSKYSLSYNRFFYYPAQFWAHKNHYTLINAFADFLKKHQDYKLVLSGSDQGNLQYIKKTVSELNIEESVVFAGFVDSDTVYTLYKNATAMTMVPIMGPTNMPPLEAMDAGCPVICSDFPGHREELGDAAIYIDPIRKESIINAMECVVNDREKYCKLIEKQRTATPHTLENALFCLNNNLIEAARIRSLWE